MEAVRQRKVLATMNFGFHVRAAKAKRGEDVTVISSGYCVSENLKAAATFMHLELTQG